MQECMLPSSQGKAWVVVSGVVLAALTGPQLQYIHAAHATRMVAPLHHQT